MNDSLIGLLSRLEACDSAKYWAQNRQVGEATYLACPRGDWLLWVLAHLDLRRPLLVLAACACARQALRYIPEGEDRPRLAIATAEAWARGGVGAPTLALVEAMESNAHDVGSRSAGLVQPVYLAALAAAAAAHVVGTKSLQGTATYSHATAAHVAACETDPQAREGAQARLADIVREFVSWENVSALLARRHHEVR